MIRIHCRVIKEAMKDLKMKIWCCKSQIKLKFSKMKNKKFAVLR